MIRLNPVGMTFFLLGIIALSFAGPPVERTVLVNNEILTTTSIDRFDQLTFYINIGETVYISVKSINLVPVEVSIGGIYMGRDYTGSNLSINYVGKTTNRSTYITVELISDFPASATVYAYVEGSEEVRNKFYLGASFFMLTGLIVEFITRKLYPPYLEDEGRSISVVAILIPVIMFWDFLKPYNGYNFRYQYNPRDGFSIAYYRSLHIEEIVWTFVNSSTMLIFYVLLAVSITRSLSKKRLQVYKTLPVDKLQQYFSRIGIWTGMTLSFLALRLFMGIFSRNGKFDGYQMFFSVYIYAFLIACIVFTNMVLLHVNVLDTFQSTRATVLIVPLLMLLSVQGNMPPIPMFEAFHRVDWETEYHPVGVTTLIFKQLFYTIILLVYGVVNRMRHGFMTGN